MFKKNFFLFSFIKHKQLCANKKLPLSYLQFLFIYKKVCKATVRNFIWLTALILILPENVFALGLGSITVFSKLNQPLKAQIELTNTHSTNIDEIIVGNASKSIYNRAGLPRPAEFRTVRFKIIKNSNGSVIVHLTSKKAFKELYITFIADLKWKDIHLNREYTFLLDPATFSTGNKKEPSPSTSISTQASSPKKRSKDKTQQSSSSYNTKKSSERTTAAANLINDNSYGPVQRNDTLSQIAQRVRPDRSVTAHQTMQAIFALNPKAFINNNINLLKQGQTLIIPTRDQVLQIISEHNSTTNNQQLPPQTANVKTGNSSEAHATKEENKSQSQLKIIPPIEELSNKLINSSDDVQLMSKTLKTSLETITLLKDTIVLLKKENTSLNSRLENLTEKLNSYDLKNKNLNDKIERISNMLEQQKLTTSISSNNSLAINNTKHQDSPLTLDSSMAAAKGNSASFIQTIMMYKTYLLLFVITIMLIVIIILFKKSNNHQNYSSKNEINFDETDKSLNPSAVNLNAIPAEQPERSADSITKNTAEKESANNINSESDFSEYFDQKINAYDQDHSIHAESEAEIISSTPAQDAHEIGLDFELDTNTTDNTPDVKDDEEDIKQLWEDSSEKADTKAKLSLKIETYIAYGKYDSAKEIIQENLSSAPEDKYLNIKLFEVYSQTKKHDEFMRHIDKVSHLLNTDPEFHQTIKQMHQDTWNRKL